MIHLVRDRETQHANLGSLLAVEARHHLIEIRIAELTRLRFAFFERGPLRAVFGFGVSYRTELDVLSATHLNFSSQLGLRFQPPQFPASFELSTRHWSNGGVRTPNRGQDFTILTVRFDQFR